jgi:hypothetical protein
MQMPDLGDRANVMGPQPIGKRHALPPAMIAAAEQILDLLAAGKRAELEAFAAPKGISELRELIEAVAPGVFDRHEILGHAKVNNHYYVKARLYGRAVAPFTFQMRLGEHQARWAIWEAVNLNGGRTAWTR